MSSAAIFVWRFKGQTSILTRFIFYYKTPQRAKWAAINVTTLLAEIERREQHSKTTTVKID